MDPILRGRVNIKKELNELQEELDDLSEKYSQLKTTQAEVMSNLEINK